MSENTRELYERYRRRFDAGPNDYYTKYWPFMSE